MSTRRAHVADAAAVKRLRRTVLAAVAIASTGVAEAQPTAGDIEAGAALARRVCSPCHAVAPDPHAPRMFEIAPDFEAIAQTPGMTETALNAFLLSSHPKMPNFILQSDQRADVIAYILSLRRRP